MNKGKIFLGILMTLGLHLLALLLMTATLFVIPGGTALVFLLGIGLLQGIYITPMALYLHSKQRKENLIGLLLGAGLTLLLNGLCWAPILLSR